MKLSKIQITIVLVLVSLLLVGMVTLTGCKKKADSGEAAVSDATEQTMCPIMNAKINKSLFTEYKGKKVYFCCAGCVGKFEKEPEKYLDKLPQFKEAGESAVTEAEKTVESVTGKLKDISTD